MSDTTISDVSETLIKLLREQMSDLINPSSITLQSPADLSGQNTRLTLFLYSISENTYMRNQQPDFLSNDGIPSPPLVVDLRYLLTTYSYVQDFTERTLEEHRLMGRAMRILYDHATLSGSVLQGGLADGSQRLRVLLETTQISEMTEIWNTFSSQNMRPSVCYTVSSAVIESSIVTIPKRVAVRELHYSPRKGEE